MNQADAATFVFGNERFQTDRLFFADPSLFQVFSFGLERGDTRSALTTPASVLLSKEAAGILLGQSDPVGATVRLDGEIDLTVTGILKDVPSNSHLQFDVLVSSDVMRQVWRPNILENYRNWIFYTYLLLSPDADPESLQEKLPAFIDRYQGEGASLIRVLELQPLSAIHFETATRREVSSNINRRILYIYGATALLILLISCVNFTNLSTARASERAREVGMRKVLGAHRSQLIGQFMGEAVVLSLISSGIAVILTGVFLPSFGELISRPLFTSLVDQFTILLLLVGLGILTGICAGLYPAFYLTSSRPILALKGQRTEHQPRKIGTRNGLMVVQFSIGVFLLVAVLTVFKQIGYMQNPDDGLAADPVVFSSLSETDNQQFETLKTRILFNPDIQKVSRGGGNMPGYTGFMQTFVLPGDVEWTTQTMLVDPDFIPLLGIQIEDGRNFDWEIITDQMESVIINEVAARELGWEESLDKTFTTPDGYSMTVIGVVRDFHFKSLHQRIRPLVLRLIPPGWSAWQVAIKVRSQKLPQALAFLSEEWQTLFPGSDFNFRVLDEAFRQLYSSDRKLLSLPGFFSGLALLITCLGLYGLVSFTSEQRTKEIGIRKTFGASVSQIVGLLVRDTMVPLVIAIVLAIPIASFAMNNWLAEFPYRVTLSWQILLLSAVIVVFISLVSTMLQSFSSAVASPVDSLSHES